MPTPEFRGPTLKLKRAEHHIDHLEAIFKEHIRRNTIAKKRAANGNPKRKAVQFLGTPLPEHVPAVIGDALHNMRAALDYAYCILVTRNGGTLDDYTRFPFRKEKHELMGSFKDQQRRSAPLPDEEAIRLIVDEIQPYEGGKLGLYELHKLDITDKHVIFVPTEQTMNIGSIEFVDDQGRVTGGWHGGQVIMPEGMPNFSVFGLGPGFHARTKVPPSFEMAFGPDQPFAGESVLQKLRTLFGNVSTALEALDRKAVPNQAT